MKSTLIALLIFACYFNVLAASGEEQILEVSTVNGSILSDPIVGFTSNGALFLPILDLGKVLGMQIEQPSLESFKIFRSANDFQLLELKGCPKKNSAPECAATFQNKNVFYLNIDYIANSLGWPISADLKSMRINVVTGNRMKENFLKENAIEKPISISRRQFGYPAARIETTLASENTRNNLNLYESQPLLGQDSDILYSKTPKDDQLRWTLSKEVVEPGNTYDVRSYELISTQTLDSKYLFSPTQITGASFSNIRRNETIFDTQNLYERGPPRWKVELYVNDTYLGETFIDVNGNFSFLNVPVFYGQNKIHYRLTSPVGKILDIEKFYNVGNEFEGRGKLKYQAAFGQRVNDSAYMGSGFINYGVTSNISAQLGYAEFNLLRESQQKKYSLAGLSFLQPTYSLSATKVTSVDAKEHAWILAPKLSAGNIFLTGEYSQFENFRSRLININDGDQLRTIKKVSALSPLPLDFPLTTQLNFLENTYDTLPASQQLQARAYAMYSRSSILVESNKFWPSEANPDLYLEYGQYSSAFRGKYGVLLQDDRYAKTKVEIESLLPNEYFLTLSAEVPNRMSDGAYALGLNRIFGDIQAEVNVLQSSSKIIYSITLSTNIKTNEHGYKLSQDENYRQANVEIFAFVDENSNGVYDPGEKPFPRLRILHGQRQKEYETNAAGLVTIPSVNPYQKLSLEIVRESISNIFLTAQDFRTDYILTPAQQLRIDVPIKPSFDIRGTIENSYFKKLVPLEILDSENKVLAITTSTAAGKYKFTDLAGGLYFIRVEPKFLTENKLKSQPESVAVEVTGKAGVRSAPEIKIQE